MNYLEAGSEFKESADGVLSEAGREDRIQVSPGAAGGVLVTVGVSSPVEASP